MWAILGVPNTKLRHQYPGLVPCCDPVVFFDPRYLHATPYIYIYVKDYKCHLIATHSLSIFCRHVHEPIIYPLVDMDLAKHEG